jgi:hypothetical protein
MEPIKLSKAHIEAVNRRRRICVDNDSGLATHFGIDVNQWLDTYFNWIVRPGSQVDSIAWCMDEGNIVAYPSKVTAVYEHPGLQKWFESDIDILQVAVTETHKQGLEAFYSYRINGPDHVGPANNQPQAAPLKEQHPDWLLDLFWYRPGVWNFAVPGVRDYKLAILRELAENYDFDGLEINFSRQPLSLPTHYQWRYRNAMTDFMRRVRIMLQEVAKKRGRPFLLSARIPSNLPGCHYDGLDLETWISENLIDIIHPGSRSIDIDIAGFRRLIGNRNIKIIPSIDDFHSTDGYRHHSIEFLRGVFSNWWHQGADGVQTFNFNPGPAFQQQALFEIGDPEVMLYKDKLFVLQRRYGEGTGLHFGDFYQGCNSQAPLPAILPADGMPAYFLLYIADDLAGNSQRIKNVELRIWLCGPTAEDEKILAKINGIQQKSGSWSPDLLSQHGELLPYTKKTPPEVPQKDGWRIFSPSPRDFAIGQNLISVRIDPKDTTGHGPVTIQKLEVHITYQP